MLMKTNDIGNFQVLGAGGEEKPKILREKVLYIESVSITGTHMHPLNDMKHKLCEAKI